MADELRASGSCNKTCAKSCCRTTLLCLLLCTVMSTLLSLRLSMFSLWSRVILVLLLAWVSLHYSNFLPPHLLYLLLHLLTQSYLCAQPAIFDTSVELGWECVLIKNIMVCAYRKLECPFELNQHGLSILTSLSKPSNHQISFWPTTIVPSHKLLNQNALC